MYLVRFKVIGIEFEPGKACPQNDKVFTAGWGRPDGGAVPSEKRADGNVSDQDYVAVLAFDVRAGNSHANRKIALVKKKPPRTHTHPGRTFKVVLFLCENRALRKNFKGEISPKKRDWEVNAPFSPVSHKYDGFTCGRLESDPFGKR